MLYIHLAALSGLLLFGLCFLLRGSKRRPDAAVLFILFALALALRLTAAGAFRGFDNDTACFAAWADRIFQVGPRGFYADGTFADYPPGYLYLLYPVGALRALLGISYGSAGHLILLKLPAIACDLGCGLLLYREAARRLDHLKPLLFTALYLFQPAVILNSSVWGQADSVYTLLLILMCLNLIRGRVFPACLSFLTGILVKPQMLLFAPILFIGMVRQSFPRYFSGSASQSGPAGRPGAMCRKSLLRVLGSGALALVPALLLCLPFGLDNVAEQYLDTVSSYPYAAVNAYNFWGMLGLNWVGQDQTLLGLPYLFYGWAAIAAAVLLVLFLGLSRRASSADARQPGAYTDYPLLAALFMASVFVFSVRMHERYLYPAVALLLFSCIYRPSRRLYLCCCGLSLLHFYNTAHVLFFYDPGNYDRKAPLILLISAGTVLFLLLLWKWALGALRSPRKSAVGNGTASAEAATGNGTDPGMEAAAGGGTDPDDDLYAPIDFSLPPSRSRIPSPLKRADFVWILLITLLYSCFALYDLGDREVPATVHELAAGESVTLEFHLAPGQKLKELAYYIAPGHKRTFSLWEGADPSDTQWTACGELTLQNVFTWQSAELPESLFNGGNGGYLGMTLTDGNAALLELVFLDQAGQIVTPANADSYPALFDEQQLYPGESSFRDSMYFDEIYHARTAYEFLKGQPAYENTHPPLGKLFIAAGVALFGMNPFGWRIMGTLFGIAMIPLVYLFARRLTDCMSLAALGCVLFAFDFMHFTQTRIATIDVYITFFVILMYYFMYLYSRLSFYDTPLKKTFLPLGACGVCMGLGIACKWTGVYAGAGLALIFFGVMYRRYREYCYAKKDPADSTEGISHETILETFLPAAGRTVAFCTVFFVLVPALIYLLSYLPFSDGAGDGLLTRLLHNQEYMFRYHSLLDSSHPYSSSWYQWPTMYRPIWYYSRIVTGSAGHGGLREGISAFGNPLVWWTGIPAVFYLLYRILDTETFPEGFRRDLREEHSGLIRPGAQKKDSTAAFLLTGYLAQYLPWFFVTRVTFIYHYFPSVAFVVLMILYSLSTLRDRMGKKAFTALLILYGTAALGLFLLFYPVLSGQPVEASFVDRFLRWFRSWVLVAG